MLTLSGWMLEQAAVAAKPPVATPDGCLSFAQGPLAHPTGGVAEWLPTRVRMLTDWPGDVCTNRSGRPGAKFGPRMVESGPSHPLPRHPVLVGLGWVRLGLGGNLSLAGVVWAWANWVRLSTVITSDDVASHAA